MAILEKQKIVSLKYKNPIYSPLELSFALWHFLVHFSFDSITQLSLDRQFSQFFFPSSRFKNIIELNI